MHGRYFLTAGYLPFDHAVDAIIHKTADVQVDRRLVYIEPDPKEPVARLTGRPPGVVGSVVGALSTIPAHQPIAGAFDQMREFNERVDRVNGVIRVAYGAVDALVPPMAGPGIDVEAFRRANKEINEDVAGAGPAYAGYLRLKLEAVIDALGAVTAGVCGFRPESDANAFVRGVVRRWAMQAGILTDEAHLSDRQVAFLKTFDLGYAERRLRFVIKRLNLQFHGVERRTAPPFRADLNSAKQDLYDLVRDIRQAQDAITSGTAPSGPAGAALQAAGRPSSARVAGRRAARVDPELRWSRTSTMPGPISTSRRTRSGATSGIAAGSPGQGFDTLACHGGGATTRAGTDGRLRRLPVLGWAHYPIGRSPDCELDRLEIVRLSPRETSLPSPAGHLLLDAEAPLQRVLLP
jgi:hypothetical protein